MRPVIALALEHAATRVPAFAAACALTFAAACAPAPASGPDGLGLRHAYWRPGDRVLVTDFRDMGAVAADRRFVYGASASGVVVYDHRMGRWSEPFTIEDGFPRAEVPLALEVDEIGGTLWMVTRTGALWAYDVALGGEWSWVGTLPGAPPVRLATVEGTLWAQTGSGWYESSLGAPPMRGTPPADVQRASGDLSDLERTSAAFRSAGSSLTVDEWLRRYEITSAAQLSRDPTRWWLSTWGGGLFAYDDRLLDAQPLRYGSIGRGVSALGATPGDGGVWFGGDGLGPRRGIAHADRDLQRWTWHEAGLGGAPAGPVYAILETPAGLFVGGEDGLFRLVGDAWQRLTDSDALPATTVRSLARVGATVWAGTDRGLARIAAQGDALGVTRIDGTSGARINALAQRDSLLWIATDRGLLHLNLETGELSAPPLDDPRLRGRITGAAADGGMLYVLAESALLMHDGGAWTAPPLAASLSGIGRPTHIAARDGIVWIAGSTGALGFDPTTNAESLLAVPRDIPEGPVRQVLPTAQGVWLATPAGALLVRSQ